MPDIKHTFYDTDYSTATVEFVGTQVFIRTTGSIGDTDVPNGALSTNHRPVILPKAEFLDKLGLQEKPAAEPLADWERELLDVPPARIKTPTAVGSVVQHGEYQYVRVLTNDQAAKISGDGAWYAPTVDRLLPDDHIESKLNAASQPAKIIERPQLTSPSTAQPFEVEVPPSAARISRQEAIGVALPEFYANGDLRHLGGPGEFTASNGVVIRWSAPERFRPSLPNHLGTVLKYADSEYVRVADNKWYKTRNGSVVLRDLRDAPARAALTAGADIVA